METEIIVRKYSDLKPFFEQKASERLISFNNQFISEIEFSTKSLLQNTKNIANNFSKIATGTAILGEMSKEGKTDLKAILTPEMKTALKNGTARLCESHKDGKIFPKIQYNDNRSEFISLKEVSKMPNFSNMTMLMNQMQMQQTLNSIQNILVDFAEETDRQLCYLQKAEHDDRILKAKLAKKDFETYLQQGDAYKTTMLHSNNDAFVTLCHELETKLEELDQCVQTIKKKITSFGTKKLMEKEQNIMKEIIETLEHLQILCNIEMYISYVNGEKDNQETLYEVQKKYSDVLIENLTEEKLKLLSGLCTLPKDIWHDIFMPGLKQIKQNKKELLLCQKNVKENITGTE